MTKKLVAKTGTYQDRQTGQEKGEYAKLGVILSNQNGEYVLLDPTINIAGVLAKQNYMARAEGKPERDMVMCSIFDDSQQQRQDGPAQQQNNSGFDGFDDDTQF